MKLKLKYLLQTLSVLSIILAGLWLKHSISSSGSKESLNDRPDTSITIIKYIDSSTHTVNHVSEFLYKNGKGKQPKTFDTLSALRAYFTSRITHNTYRDSNISFTVYDTLLANSITGRSIDYKILKPCAQIIKTIRKPDKGWYIGAAVTSKAAISPTVSYCYKNWQIGATMINSGGNAVPLFNLQYKIK